MKVIEQFLKSKTHNESDCEDSLFVSEHFAAVIDGTTSKSNLKYRNETSGKACSQLIKKALEELPVNSTALQAVEFLTSAVFSMYKESGIQEHVLNSPSERASAGIVIYSRTKNEIWMVGDCQCRIDGAYYSNTKAIDCLLSDIRSLFIQTELKQGISLSTIQDNDSGREYITPLLKRQSVFQNSIETNEFTYGVIDGFKVPESEIKVIKLSEPTTIILATDGYPRLFDTLTQSEGYLNKILSNDPLCFQKFKSTKGLKPGNCSFDDRAFLSLLLR
jgi:hypothetical protein